MPAQRGVATFLHSSGGGFCVICGTVWPCSQAETPSTEVKTLIGSSS